MLKTLKKFTTFVLSLSFILSLSTPAFAGNTRDMGVLPSKTSKDLGNLQYEIRLKVPGVDGSNIHDEVILMVDGSYSGDAEWPAMKEAIIKIGEYVLNGNGNTQLTLMAFGMGDNEVLVHVKTVDELKAKLGNLPGYLLYGRSSTNCEAGFTGVANYIARHDSTLNDTYVIYISDGGVNMDETPRDFYNWKSYAKLRPAETIIANTFELECEAIDKDGRNRSEAFVEIFGAEGDILSIAKAATPELLDAYNQAVWEYVYAYSNLTPGTEYPVSVAERAFVKYDKEHNTYIQDNFYYAIYRGLSYPDRFARAKTAARSLAANNKVKSLYIVDNNTETAWMREAGGENFISAGSISNIVSSMEGALSNLAKTPYNDVVITDYMSKWVNLDTATLKITDTKSGKVLWTSADGWLVSEGRPTAAENPVVIETVAAENYAAGGPEVEGNISGDIYKLTWYVKDGALLRNENYRLTYTVNVDTEEAGFVWDTAYDANGATTVEYTDEGGTPQKDNIPVPDVEADQKWWPYKLTINYVDENGNPVRTSHTEELIAGAAYDVDSPAVKGFIPDKTVVAGNMPAKDTVIDVVYKPRHSLIIHYVYEDGTEAQPDHKEEDAYVEGDKYGPVDSPVIDGYKPTIETVEGTIGNKDEEITVVYKKLYPLTIHYVYEDGTEAAPDYFEKFTQGEKYGPIDSPVIDGFIPSLKTVVSDEKGMKPEAVEITVVYRTAYKLTIHYVYEDGRTAAPDYTEELAAGSQYGPVYSPVINGFNPDYAFIKSDETGMPAEDVVLKVVYKAVPVIVPAPVAEVTPPAVEPVVEPEPTPVPTPSPAPAGPVIVPVDEQDVPLAEGDLGPHICCILHYLLMFTAMLILAWHTKNKKDKMEKIAELTEELDALMIENGLEVEIE